MTVEIIIGDMRERLRDMAADSIDSCVTDPPYHLTSIVKRFGAANAAPCKVGKTGAYERASRGFMGQQWDGGDVAFDPATWAEVLRVLKPGAFLAAFGGTRTFHRMACAIEDAGFEIRDTISWNFGSGFPKSHNISRALADIPACNCAEVASHGGVVIDAASPLGLSSAGVGAELSPVNLAGITAGTDGLGLEALAETDGRKPIVQGGVEDADGHLHPIMLRPFDVAGITEREQIAHHVGRGQVDPEALRDQVVRDEIVDPSAVSASPVPFDDSGGDGAPRLAFVPPSLASPSGIASALQPLGIVDGHAGAGTVGAWPPTHEVIGPEDDGASLTSKVGHKADGATKRTGLQCEVCGGVITANIPQGLGTALKPAMELICLARKPLVGTVAANVLQHGTGALNIDGCRVETNPDVDDPRLGGKGQWNNRQEKSGRTVTLPPKVLGSSALGRWPANIIHDGSEEVLAGFPDSDSKGGGGSPSTGFWGNAGSCDGLIRDDAGSAARFFYEAQSTDDELFFCRAKTMLLAWHNELANTADNSSTLSSEAAAFVLSGAATWALREGRQLSVSPELSTSATPIELRLISEAAIAGILISESGCWPEWQRARPIPNGCHVQCAETREPIGTITITISHWKSNGSAAPVTFSITRPNSDHGARDLKSDRRFTYCAKADSSERHIGGDNSHPTVKPLDLMRWLVTLVTPKGGTVLDPFMGSGSTLVAADRAQFSAIGIELSEQYAEIARKRLSGDRGGLLDAMEAAA